MIHVATDAATPSPIRATGLASSAARSRRNLQPQTTREKAERPRIVGQAQGFWRNRIRDAQRHGHRCWRGLLKRRGGDPYRPLLLRFAKMIFERSNRPSVDQHLDRSGRAGGSEERCS